MAMLRVEPLVPYHTTVNGYTLATLERAYAPDKTGHEEYEVFSYDFCTHCRMGLDAGGTYTQVNITAYIKAGPYAWGQCNAHPHIKDIQVWYVDDDGNLVNPYASQIEYETSFPDYSNVQVDGETVQVLPYLNISFKVRSNLDGTPKMNGKRLITINSKCAYSAPALFTTAFDYEIVNSYGFYTKPYVARITGAGSFYNQTSIDNGTADSFTMNVTKTNDIGAEQYEYDENDYLVKFTCTQYLGLSSNGVTADIIPFQEVDCDATRVTLTITAAIQDWLLQWCNDATSKPIYYILQTTYGGYTHQVSMQRYFLVGNAEPSVSLSYMDYNPITTALTGDNQAWIKRASNLDYSYGAYAQKHATIVSRYVKCGSFYTTKSGAGEIIEPDGDYIEVGCTDSRGLTASKIITPTKVYEYFKPTAVIHCTNMTGDGEVELTFSGRFKNVYFANQNNTLVLQYRYKKDSDEAYGDWITVTSMNEDKTGSLGDYHCSVTLENMDYRATYHYQSRIIDLINVVESAEIVGASIPIFDWSEVDFNFNVPVTIKGAPVERISEQGTDDFWTYILWDSGLCECWGTYSGEVSLSNSEGALYYSDTIEIQYPTESPAFENVLVSGGGSGASWVRTTDDCSNSKVAFKVIGAVNENTSITANIHAWGRWR